MANKIVIKHSSELGKIPLVSDLDYGELAINYKDGSLYYKTTDDIIKNILLHPWLVKTSNYTTSNGERIIANTSGGQFTVKLPASPNIGDYVQITDGSDFHSINLAIDGNGSTVENINDIILLDIKGSTYEFIYSGSTWQITATTGAQLPFVNYNVTTVSTNYAIQTTDRLIVVNSVLDTNLTLPLASDVAGQSYQIKNININKVTILPSGSDTIDGNSNLVIQYQYSSVILASTGYSWAIF